MIIYCIEDGSEKAVMETLQLSCEVQKRPSYILTSLLRGSLGAAGSRLIPDFVNGLWLKDDMGRTIPLQHLVKI